jgi:hypothetical protein
MAKLANGMIEPDDAVLGLIGHQSCPATLNEFEDLKRCKCD